MNYPLISEYIEAIKSAEDNFEQLNYLRPVLGDDGLPVMTSGNFAVVFKMKDEQSGKFYAVKCFTKEQEGRDQAYREIAKELKDVSSPYLVSIQYLENELFVDTDQTAETEFPVLLMDWVDGKTLDKYLRENLDDKYALEMLAYRFSQLAQWLIPQPFAHGDLKPDNILVREDGTLVLVDYDGMYVPAMKGQKARELGSPDFRHPLRTEEDFDEHIDDFPLVSILLSLKAISIDSQLLNEYGAANRLLFSVSDYSGLKSSRILKTQFPSDDNEANLFYGLFISIIASKQMFLCGGNILGLSVPLLSTEIPSQCHEIWEGCIRYSQDFKRVLGIYGRESELPFVPYDITEIDKRARIICDDAFNTNNTYWVDTDIYDRPCVTLADIEVPKGVFAIGKGAFSNHDLFSISLPDSLVYIGDYAFSNSNIEHLSIPEGIVNIGDGIFYACSHLKSVKLPQNITVIPKQMFEACKSIETIRIPEGVKIIRESAFKDCSLLESIYLPETLTQIDESVFNGCSSLKSIQIPSSLSVINNASFRKCTSITNITIPENVQEIDDYAFEGCEGLSSIIIQGNLERIGSHAFSRCTNIQTIVFPTGIKKIDNFAFEKCQKLNSITLPKDLKEISLYAFWDCPSLKRIYIPNGTKLYFDQLLDKMYKEQVLFNYIHPISMVEKLKQLLFEKTDR